MSQQRPAREFTIFEGVAFLLAYIGIQINSEVINQWGMYFYSPSEDVGRTVYVAAGTVGIIFIIGTVWDAITDPLVGSWSDRLSPARKALRWLAPSGRRRPFIFWGAVLQVFTLVAFWYPPVAGESGWNLAYGTVALCAHWLAFTIMSVPILALGPEIARRESERVRLGFWIGLGFIAGLAIAVLGLPMLLDLVRTAPPELPPEPDAYRKSAMILAVVSLLMMQPIVWLVRERYTERPDVEQRPVLAGYFDAARNAPFLIYFIAFFMFTVGFLASQRALPYWAELGLGGDEGTLTMLLGPYLVTAILTIAALPFIAGNIRPKWFITLALFILASGLPFMYVIGTAGLPSETKILLGGMLFGYAGVGQGIIYVMITPLMGEIIDYDEQRSGQRREALYNGLSGVVWKAAMAFSILVADQSMAWWGKSVSNPAGVYLVGPIAGVLGLIGMVAMLFYPKLHVTRDQIERADERSAQ